MDDECDYRSPIGQIIKQVNTLCKKPTIDEQLQLALELFGEKIKEQQNYMNNGIFKINFAESALFLQSCADLYSKKVDLLWDQLLEFHTRLIEYDFAHEKEKGKNLNDDVIKQLEERRNRYKRKKKFKLVLAQDENYEGFLFDKQTVDKNSDKERNIFDSDEMLQRDWRHLESKGAKLRSIPNAIYKQQLTMYRMKNYHIMKSQDFDVFDIDDGEFNTKYSRIPGWHHILHLFEYNSKGLLPDKQNLIATLRLGAYLRAKFMRDRKIPFGAHYSDYKEEYLTFKKQFLETEAKKWQNMPLDNLQDLHKQLEYLSRKECSANMDGNALLSHPDEESRKCDTKSLEKMIDDCDDDSLFELSIGCPNDQSNSDLFVRLEKLSSEIINTKFRQDSGFFDSESECGDDGNHGNRPEKATESSLENTENSLENTEKSLENTEKSPENTEKSPESTGKSLENTENALENTEKLLENTEKSPESIEKSLENTEKSPEITEKSLENTENSLENTENSLENTENSLENTENSLENNTVEHSLEKTSADESLFENLSSPIREQDKENVDPHNSDDDNFDARSVMSDHCYCTVPRKILEENNNLLENKNFNTVTREVMAPFRSTGSRIIPRTVEFKHPKDNKVRPKIQINSPSPPKKRKLSARQLGKLLDSLVVVPSVKDMKFEQFFSKNYQPQLGEGEIPEVEYNSDSSDAEDHPSLPVKNSASETHSVHDCDDVRSIMSDHNYSQITNNNDSGFVSSQRLSLNSMEEDEEEHYDESLREIEAIPSSSSDRDVPTTARGDPEGVHDEEYQRLLESLKESRGQQNDNIQTEGPLSAQQLNEQEKNESRARINEWKNTINPILRNLKEQDFNIHEYGSRIMDGMEINDSKPFRSIVDGKSSAEVVRYFIASLQLANTYNIEICGAKQGQLSNDTFEVKMLKKDRYHEHLDDYQAPSEESFKEKLKRVGEMKDGDKPADSCEPSSKRRFIQDPVKSKKRRKTIMQSNNNCLASNTIEDDTFTTKSVQEIANNPELRNTNWSTYQQSDHQLDGFASTQSKDIPTSSPNPYKGKDSMRCYGSTCSMSYTTSQTRSTDLPTTSDKYSSVLSCSTNPLTTFYDGCSSSSECGEEVFRKKLVSMQNENTGIQVFSTPLEKKRCRFEGTSLKGRSLVFE